MYVDPPKCMDGQAGGMYISEKYIGDHVCLIGQDSPWTRPQLEEPSTSAEHLNMYQDFCINFRKTGPVPRNHILLLTKDELQTFNTMAERRYKFLTAHPEYQGYGSVHFYSDRTYNWLECQFDKNWNLESVSVLRHYYARFPLSTYQIYHLCSPSPSEPWYYISQEDKAVDGSC